MLLIPASGSWSNRFAIIDARDGSNKCAESDHSFLYVSAKNSRMETEKAKIASRIEPDKDRAALIWA